MFDILLSGHICDKENKQINTEKIQVSTQKRRVDPSQIAMVVFFYKLLNKIENEFCSKIKLLYKCILTLLPYKEHKRLI